MRNNKNQLVNISSSTNNLNLEKMFTGRQGLLCILAFTFVVHLAISRGSYSGHGEPPMYGDFEAQRHWMEITVNLPIEQWYINNTNNDLNYWGLDYPPLTAYHSWLLGKISQYFNSSWVELHSSRGIEEDDHKLFMRFTVLATLWSLYVPTVLYFSLKGLNDFSQNYFAAIVLLFPGLISIDNGHFQYNHVALGLFLIAFLFYSANRLVYGSVFFVLAVNFKQMELYHALPIATYLFFTCFPIFYRKISFFKSVALFSKLAAIVVLTILCLWMPLRKTNGFPFTVLNRIFPFYRGIFEDKVANFWCAANVLVKLKQKFFVNDLLRLSAAAVLITHIPSLLVVAWRPTIENLKKSLFLSSLSFFLFSFQVHEKSILFVAIPALLMWPSHRVSMSWFLFISSISLYPLCIQDGNALHLAMFIFYFCLVLPSFAEISSWKRWTVYASCTFGLITCLAAVCINPPKRFPHIFSLWIALFSFGHFICFFIYFNFLILRDNFKVGKTKKH